MRARQQQRHAVVVRSPHSGASHHLDEALIALQQAYIAIDQLLPIAELDSLPPQGTAWRQQGIDLIIAAGGDGLIGGVLTDSIAGKLPLGILPLGTSNDIARSFSIPLDITQAVAVIAMEHERAVDVGVAQPAEQAPHSLTSEITQPSPALQDASFFVHTATVGINIPFAHIATSAATRQRYGHLTYPFAALEALKNYQALEVQLRFEGVALPPVSLHGRAAQPSFREEDPATLQCRAFLVAVINAPIFGGRWNLALPHARMDDGLLDILVIQDSDLGQLGKAFTWLGGARASLPTDASTFQQHPADLIPLPGIAHIQARGVTIATSTDPQDATLDGEIRGRTPLHAQVAKERLRVFVPSL